jgi:hypothetical protein
MGNPRKSEVQFILSKAYRAEVAASLRTKLMQDVALGLRGVTGTAPTGPV